jgi:DNA-binding NarL/FixJ family response regulator
VRRLHPDVVLLDLRMPGKPPLDAVVELYEHVREPHVVVLSGYLNWRTVIEALGAGVIGVVSKSDDPRVLAELIGRAAHGEPVLSPSVQSLLESAA